MKPLVDWFCCSFKSLKNLSCIFHWFGLNQDEFKSIVGRWNYHDGLWMDGITFYFNWKLNNAKQSVYDVCVNLSGQGCRRFETIKGEVFDWVMFLHDIQCAYRKNINVSRIDIALDIQDDSVPSMLKIIDAVEKRKYISNFRRVVTG